MSEVTITTVRGVALSGTFIRPVDCRDAAVLFSHSFLADRHSGEHFDRLARAYRAAGYATLEFDYSGHGRSGDDIISQESQIADLQAASAWLAEQGLDRQLIHGHSFGAVTALASHLPCATAMVLSAPVLGPVSYDWTAIFSSVQLDELEEHGVTTIPDDSPGPRRHFTISKQTLADLSMVDREKLLDPLDPPVLIIHDADDMELGLVELTQEAFPLLADGSRVELVHDVSFGAGESPELLVKSALEWARMWLPAHPSGLAEG